MAADAPAAPLAAALAALRDEAAALTLGLEVAGAAEARAQRDELVRQVDDYLLPRLGRMDAPLLMVVGGSTGAGKSTLVNSLVGAVVSPAGVLRPTTRAPVLVCNPGDLAWFESAHVLPDLSRTTGGAATGGLQLVPTAAVAPGVALLDSSDIDSVVETNRALSRQLLAAADAWLFVTTAARYADAVPWDLLQGARERGTSLALVLNRVPDDAADDIVPHLAAMLAERGLAGTDVLVVPETELADGLLPAAALAPVRDRLDELAADAGERTAIVRRTLGGALDSLAPRVERLADAAEDQLATAEALRADVDSAYGRALEEVDEAIASGSLLRGEVLARWHEVVGTGELMRSLETQIGRVRDRLRSLLTGRPTATRELEAAVESSVDAVVHAAADRAAEQAAGRWREREPGGALLAGAARLDAVSPGFLDRTRDAVRAWQGQVFELVRAEGSDKRSAARLASFGVNGVGLAVMLGVFTQTGGLTGAEVVVAGGTSAVGQRILEAILGDQAVRALAARARTDLVDRVRALLDAEAARFSDVLEPAVPDDGAPARLRDALSAVARGR